MIGHRSPRPDLPNLLLAANLSAKVNKHQECLRQVACKAAESGVPAPCGVDGFIKLSRRLAPRPWQPANFIQVQRDYFGARCRSPFCSWQGSLLRSICWQRR